MFKKNNYLYKILKLVKLDEMEILPGHLAFYLIFIIIPVITFIDLLSFNFDINILDIIEKNVPRVVVSLFSNLNNNNFNNINIFLFTLLSLLLSSKGAKAIIIASNILFKRNNKDIMEIRIKSIIIVIILFILITFIIIFLVLGDIIIKYLTISFNNNFSTILYSILKYPISVILIFILIKVVYTISSDKINSKYMNKGAFFTTIMWLLLSRIYSFYLNNYNHYDIYYGSLSNILILLVWVYLLSYIFTIGMALNASNYLDLKSN